MSGRGWGKEIEKRKEELKEISVDVWNDIKQVFKRSRSSDGNTMNPNDYSLKDLELHSHKYTLTQLLNILV